MSAALDVLMVVAARVLTESLWALATGSDVAHASVWAFEVTGDVISAGEPGGHMSARKITDDGALLLAVNCKPWPAARLETCGRGRDLSRCTAMKWAHHPNLRKRPCTPAKGRGSVQRAIRRAFAASGTPIRRSDGLECRSPGPQPERPCGVPVRASRPRHRPVSASAGSRYDHAGRQGHVSDAGRLCRVRTLDNSRACSRWLTAGQA